MSKDQLGWDQILNNQGDSEAAKEVSPEAPASEALAETKPKAKARKSRKAETETTELYAQKDWSKLEVTKSPATAAQPESSEAKKTETSVEIKAQIQEKSVSIPLVKSPQEVSYEPEAEGSKEPKTISVSELNRYIKDILEGTFSTIWLKGEISNFKAHTSGHFYFSLKDSKAQVSAVMFRGYNGQLKFRPQDGMEVIVRGKITVYEPRGNYQIFCELMEPVGAGALQKAFEQLKAKLQKEGLFDQEKKRSLPSLPKHIAIVTSPTGAAIRDMLNVLGRRFKGLQITVIPCKVQGDAAPKEIVEAINLANQLKDVDVMIVGRGGGSIEDLWAFNDERVARAIAATRVPTISAVGHEIDFTIADFVADLRAPTPSAAAELVVRNAADVSERVKQMSRSMQNIFARLIQGERQRLLHISRRLVDPQRKIQDASQRCDELLQRLELSIARLIDIKKPELARLDTSLKSETRNALTRKRDVLQKNMAVLDSLSPLKVLDRGFSMVLKNESIVTDAETLKIGDEVHIRMCQGSIDAKVTKIDKKR